MFFPPSIVFNIKIRQGSNKEWSGVEEYPSKAQCCFIMALLLFILLTDAANEENESFSHLTDIYLYQRKYPEEKCNMKWASRWECVNDYDLMLDESIFLHWWFDGLS